MKSKGTGICKFIHLKIVERDRHRQRERERELETETERAREREKQGADPGF